MVHRDEEEERLSEVVIHRHFCRQYIFVQKKSNVQTVILSWSSWSQNWPYYPQQGSYFITMFI